MEITKEIGEQKFPSIAHCALTLMYNYGEVWSNARIAEEVKRIMGSKTGPGNISWYKVEMKKGKLKMSDFVDMSVEPLFKKTEKPVQPKPVPTQSITIELAPELVVSTESLTTQAPNSTIQQFAMDFFNTRSEKSFNALYSRIQPGMSYHAMQILKDKSLADDVVNVAFTKIWQKIEQYNPYWCFSTWAYKIVRNEAMQLVRRNKPYSSMDDVNGVDKSDGLQFIEFVGDTHEGQDGLR